MEKEWKKNYKERPPSGTECSCSFRVHSKDHANEEKEGREKGDFTLFVLLRRCPLPVVPIFSPNTLQDRDGLCIWNNPWRATKEYSCLLHYWTCRPSGDWEGSSTDAEKQSSALTGTRYERNTDSQSAGRQHIHRTKEEGTSDWLDKVEQGGRYH